MKKPPRNEGVFLVVTRIGSVGEGIHPRPLFGRFVNRPYATPPARIGSVGEGFHPLPILREGAETTPYNAYQEERTRYTPTTKKPTACAVGFS